MGVYRIALLLIQHIHVMQMSFVAEYRLSTTKYLDDLTVVMIVFAVLAVLLAYLRVKAYRKRNCRLAIDIDLLVEYVGPNFFLWSFCILRTKKHKEQEQVLWGRRQGE